MENNSTGNKCVEQTIMNKRKKKEKGIIAFFIIILFVSIASDLSIITLPKALLANVNDMENLFVTLFTVQASVATMGIAIVSIITGLVDEYILGVSLSAFITNIRPKIFKHDRLIITNLIITGVNYISLAFSFYNLCIAFFVISIGITILLIREVYVVFLGKQKIQNEIEEYIVDNYDEEIVKKLGIELIEAIETNSSLIIKNDFKAIIAIFEKEIEMHRKGERSYILQISLIVEDVFRKTADQQNGARINDCLENIVHIYEIANRDEENPIYLDIWDDIYRDVFQSFKYLSFDQLTKNMVFSKLHSELYKNSKNKLKENNNSSLRYFSCWTYFSLFGKKNDFTGEEQRRLKANIYAMPYINLHYSASIDESTKRTLTYELCNLHKVMIDEGDFETLNKEFFKYISSKRKDKHIEKVYFITLLYLYYLSSRESLLEGSDMQATARKIIEDNKKKNDYFYYHINLLQILDDVYMVRDILNQWEYMPIDDAKWMVMDNVVTDFFVFAALGKFWEKEEISKTISAVVPGSMFSIYSRYFSQNDFSSLKRMYESFEEMFSNHKKDDDKSKETLDSKISLLNDICNDMYKIEVLEEGKKERITIEQEEAFAEKVRSQIEKVYLETLNVFRSDDVNEEEGTYKDTVIYVNVLSNYFFTHTDFDKYINEDLFTQTITAFLRSIHDHIKFEYVTYDSKDKQRTLIDLAESIDIIPDTVIGNRDEFWGEEESSLLSNYSKGMNRIKYPGGYNYYFILESSSIEFYMDNISIEFSNLTWKEIKNKCRERDGEITFNVTNDIFIPFKKSEIEEYISDTERKMIVCADIKVRLKKDKVGAGIEIVAEEKE